ncbi:MAG: PadR family transcriptional regulator [Actinomycetota bacterium]|nr:PadR family transcriptional regulator [Actinomycetota bacterium]
MELSATGRVILGVLAVEPRSGYDIKALTDRSTRFFWAASYGQIYPELKRLAERGLVEGTDESHGGRKRTVYAITPAGRDALAAWLNDGEMTHELRDEGLLKLFFAATQGGQTAASVLREKREAHAAALAELRAIEPDAQASGRFGPAEVLAYGLAYNEFAVHWCEQILQQIETED